MLEDFKSFCRKESLLSTKDKVLIAVSGGVDSVVLCHLAYQAGWKFGIAHCNFKLRGKESDADEKFVKALAAKYQVPFYRANLSARKYATKKKISIQMAAREMRYQWFEKIVKEKKYSLIASAHHLDDSIETLFINLIRGTGISGLKGIPAKNDKIIRPLLYATKDNLLDFAKKEKLTWREDSSNAGDQYLRNKIRHQVIPSIKKLNLGFEKTLARELTYFKDAAGIFKEFIDKKKKELLEYSGDEIRLNIEKLKKSQYPETVLYETLRAYDFTPETTELIFKRIYTTAGKKFLSPTYKLIRDREFFILSPLKTESSVKDVKINRTDKKLKWDGKKIVIENLKYDAKTKRLFSNDAGNLDLDQLTFPLTFRKWKRGDRFRPLGMKGTKKISDFLIDNKVSLNNKEQVMVLESAGKIAWVAGFRPDERFKVKTGTKTVFRIKIIQ